MHNKQGFSFVELIITASIIAVVASVAIPSYITHIHRTKAVKALSNLDTIRKAEISYFHSNGAFNSDLAVLGQYAGGSIKADDGDWTYNVFNNASQFLILATRTSGKYNAQNIWVTSNNAWGGTYTGPGAP